MTAQELIAARARLLRELADVNAALLARGVKRRRGRIASARVAVLEALRNGPASVCEIRERTGQAKTTAHHLLSTLTRAGVIRRLGRGCYALPAADARGR